MVTMTSKLVRRPRRLVLVAMAVAASLLVSASSSYACQKQLYDAAAKYAQCDFRSFAKLYANLSADNLQRLVAKCRRTYVATWAKIAAKGSPAAACSGARFVDHGNGTVTDKLTGLQWEQKTDDGGIHDKDALYTWSAGISQADGTVFTDFLASLNSGACFAGHCDWRLPTRAELQLPIALPHPCTTPPCIDESVFGPTAPAFHWSSTTNATGDGFAWGVQFATGVLGAFPKSTSAAARAVRTGW